MKDFGYNKEESKLFKKLNTPSKIQDFLNSIPFDLLHGGEECASPRKVLQKNSAHCVEGAILAAAILEFHGSKPWVLDLRSTSKPFDYDHFVAVFVIDGYYGAISKTNHNVLRYREPVYRTLRELVLSYFHEYFLNSGVKTLREYSKPFDLNYFNKLGWRTTSENLYEIPAYIDGLKHYSLLTPKQVKNLRKADKVEIEAGKIVEYKKD